MHIVIIQTQRGVFDGQYFFATIQNLFHCFGGNIPDSCFELKSVFFAQSFDLPKQHAVSVFSKGYDTSFVDGLAVVGYYFVEVDLIDKSQTLTTRTGSLGRIERKRMRSGLAV
jgi:hypothetical protein